MKYLVTDDSKMARRMMIKALRSLINEDDVIIECTNGQEALELYKEERPNICFMDLTMPVMDGFEAVKLICEFDSNAKIITVSADIQEGSINKIKESGSIGFIKKPINEKNLADMLIKLNLL